MSLHYANVVQDTDGFGGDLLQYSYVEMKQDLLHWLREAGRLPSASMKEYFQEIMELNQLKEENKELRHFKEESKVLQTRLIQGEESK